MSENYFKKFPIDIVYLWCDASDKVWKEKKNALLKSYGKPLDNDSTSDCRFINNDELKYSLRSLEKYAPWIRNIFIVTDSQVPKWLDVTNPKIRIIDHTQILPKDCLPTFNASAIETALHKIPELGEHFLFANDDMLFGQPVSPEFFFDSKTGEPIFRFSKRKLINKPYRHLYGYMVSSAYKMIKERYGKSCPYFPHHNIDAYRKSDMEKCYEEFRQGFEETAHQQFREKECIQRSIFGFYSVANKLGTYKIVDDFCTKLHNFFIEKPQDSVMFGLTKAKLKKLEKNTPCLFCINDSLKTTDDDRVAMKEFLNTMFPYPSSFEKQQYKPVDINICYHKQSKNYLKNDILSPIQVGAALSKIDLGIAKDNTGDNISAKNKNYCELTALYHLWKNSNADYKGLMHYRRLFDLSCGTKRWFHGFPDHAANLFLLNKNTVNAILSQYDLVLPMKRIVQKNKNLYDHYKKHHFITDLDKCLELIEQKYPQIYPTTVDVLKNKNELYLYNMFIASKEFVNDYASWLFDILFSLEAEIQADVETRNEFQKRVYGFLSERLFTVYVEYRKTQGLKVKEVPVVYDETNKKRFDIFQSRTKLYRKLVRLGIRRPHWKEQYGV